jgi:hypothetical protein
MRFGVVFNDYCDWKIRFIGEIPLGYKNEIRKYIKQQYLAFCRETPEEDPSSLDSANNFARFIDDRAYGDLYIIMPIDDVGCLHSNEPTTCIIPPDERGIYFIDNFIDRSTLYDYPYEFPDTEVCYTGKKIGADIMEGLIVYGYMHQVEPVLEITGTTNLLARSLPETREWDRSPDDWTLYYFMSHRIFPAFLTDILIDVKKQRWPAKPGQYVGTAIPNTRDLWKAITQMQTIFIGCVDIGMLRFSLESAIIPCNGRSVEYLAQRIYEDSKCSIIPYNNVRVGCSVYSYLDTSATYTSCTATGSFQRYKTAKIWCIEEIR